MKESIIEKAVCKYAKETGWWLAKFNCAGKAHVPDRIFIKTGKVIFIEFKATGEKARIAQVKRIEEMQNYGAVCYVIDDIAQGCEVLENA